MDSEGQAKHFSSVHRWNPSEGRPGCGSGAAPGAQACEGDSLHGHTGCAAAVGNADADADADAVLLKVRSDRVHDSLDAVPCGLGGGCRGCCRGSKVVGVAVAG